MGASIHRAGIQSSGTLGCFIQLLHPNGVRSIYGLTNFHVVMPDFEDYDNYDNQTLSWIQYGLQPGFASIFRINMPCEIDLDAARTSYVSGINQIQGDVVSGEPGVKDYLDYRALEAQGENPELCMPMVGVRRAKMLIDELAISQARINAIDSRRNNMRLGVVYAGSGIRQRRSQQILDWALINVDDARVPAANDLPPKIGEIFMPSQMTLIGSLALGQAVFKIGRRSNLTYGFVNPAKSTQLLAWVIRNGTPRYEVGYAWAVMDRKVDDDEGKDGRGSGYFSDKGDSGSAVFTKAGEFVGLLYGGVEPGRQVSYIMSAEDLVEDIKYITGATEVTMLESKPRKADRGI
jgi:hypothetical protein